MKGRYDMNLEEVLVWTSEKDYEEKFLDTIKEEAEFIIFGAGIGGEKTFSLLKKVGLSQKVVAFVDNNMRKVGSDYCGVKVISADKILQVANNPIIIISSTAYDRIVGQLEKMGVEKKRTVYFQPARLLEGDQEKEFIRSHIQEFSFFYDMLKDEKSKEIVVDLLNYRITKEQKWLDKMADYVDDEKEQYFDTEILDRYEVEEGFVDGGAYIGDTLEEFIKHFPTWKTDYYCFEADEEICSILRLKVDKMQLDYVQIYEYALWNTKTQIAFDNSIGGAGNHIGEGGKNVNCISIDSALVGKQIDFIKMDIEGAEHNAIEGAKETIKKCLPVMAICVYHKPEDFYDILMLIHNISSEYKFYIRQYRYGQTETVLYAVPDCRRKKNEE